MSARNVIVRLNGEAREFVAGNTVEDLVSALGLARDRFAVEINRQIVPRSEHATRRLQDGDAIEVVSFVGGG